MEKLADNEIIKALECCNSTERGHCLNKCPYYNYSANCTRSMINDARDLINRQKAEIFELKKQVEHFQSKNGELFKLNNNIVEENGYKDAEIERLKKSRDDLYEEMSERQKEEVEIVRRLAKSEAYKEFAVQCYKKAFDRFYVSIDEIVEIEKELSEQIKLNTATNHSVSLIDGHIEE